MLRKIQEEQAVWSLRNFGKQPSWQPLLGAVEELGELAHAHLKATQGIRKNEQHVENEIDAIGDIIIYLIAYCNSRGHDIEKIVQHTWDQVKQRDWVKNPDTAHIGKGDTK